MMHIVHEKREEQKSMKRNPHENRMDYARLQAAGIPVPAEEQSIMQPDLQAESLKGSRVFDLKMGSELLLNLRISNHSYANLRINRLQVRLLEAAWWLIVELDPREQVPERKTYRMLSGRYVRYESVLNHRLDEIAPGASIEGKLLALSVIGTIPEEYAHGMSIPLELVLTDRYGRQHASIIEVLVDRSATMSKPEVFNRVGRGLYDGSPRPPEFEHRVPAQAPVGKAYTGETNEKQSDTIKKLRDCIAFLTKADLDAIPAESTSTRDEVGRTRGNGRHSGRAPDKGKGSGPSARIRPGKPPDLCVGEDGRRRYLGVVAAEKLAQQRSVPR